MGIVAYVCRTRPAKNISKTKPTQYTEDLMPEPIFWTRGGVSDAVRVFVTVRTLSKEKRAKPKTGNVVLPPPRVLRYPLTAWK